MPTLSREGTARGRAARRRPPLRRDRRALISAAIPVAFVAVLALVMGVMGRNDQAATAPVASPVPSPDLGSGARPPELVIARADGVQVHIPVDPGRVTAMAFHPIDDPSGIAMSASAAVHIHQASRAGRAGPDTAGLDVGAPAGTTVYAPVDGVIQGVSDYTLFGRVEGYEVDIAPAVAAGGMVLRLTHLDEPPNGVRPVVGTPVRAGVTELGRVRDFSAVARQEIAKFTADSGNHVELSLVRAEAALAL